ncbi:LacI family DNA-binding transcriptional regulator [Falsibacillus pallidus]|uniref:LacI family transcriptional regulator n=1 Tax=Falsibacillus pallidus TaxID=493781 RepID=A0A370G0Y9_9BACI|nr:substrate-binding domain-containing protein [Falsibacillus pallidus]RDI36890.1 LacI family transcriptional regulator [Falsibacillus pallidus]
MSATIKDVAKHANVSIATVSRIINKKPGFSPETEQKVLDSIQALGYQPNALARGLINKDTQTIGVLFPAVSNMFASEVLSGIEEYANEMGSSVIVCNTAEDGERTLKYLQVLSEKRVDGIIIVSEYIKEEYYKALSEMKIPKVLVSSISFEYPIPYVKVDDRHASFSAVNYLIGKGHRKIAMIAGNSTDPIAGVPRIEGYMAALRANGIEPSNDMIIHCDGFGHKDGVQAMKDIMDRDMDITAVFASSDELAVGAMSHAIRHGIRVPDDLSVMGYDDTKLAEMMIPSLTTVAQPLYEMGLMAATMLFDMKSSGAVIESRIMNHKIMERETVKNLL